MLERLTDPYSMLLRMQSLMDELLGGGWTAAAAEGGPGGYPPINVFKRGESYVVVAEMPGVRIEDLDLQVAGNRLRISGSRPHVYGEGVTVHRRERGSGAFARSVDLPVEVDPDRVQAELREGMLAVLLEPEARARPRKVPVH